MAQCTYHLLWYVNVRATAHGHTSIAMISDASSVVMQMLILRRVIKSETSDEWFAMFVGGLIGSWLGLNLPMT